MNLKFHKYLVIGTTFFSLVIAIVVTLHHLNKPPQLTFFKTEGIPCLGPFDAPVEMVLFEDFQCTHCRTFNHSILPEIYQKYIEKGLVKLTLFPVHVIEGSRPLAHAALAVQKIAPERYFHFVEELFDHVEQLSILTDEKILEIAKEVGEIDLAQLESCLKSQCQSNLIDKNLELIRDAAGYRVGIPALYINGELVPTTSFEELHRYIENAISKGKK